MRGADGGAAVGGHDAVLEATGLEPGLMAPAFCKTTNRETAFAR